MKESAIISGTNKQDILSFTGIHTDSYIHNFKSYNYNYTIYVISEKIIPDFLHREGIQTWRFDHRSIIIFTWKLKLHARANSEQTSKILTVWHSYELSVFFGGG